MHMNRHSAEVDMATLQEVLNVIFHFARDRLHLTRQIGLEHIHFQVLGLLDQMVLATLQIDAAHRQGPDQTLI